MAVAGSSCAGIAHCGAEVHAQAHTAQPHACTFAHAHTRTHARTHARTHPRSHARTHARTPGLRCMEGALCRGRAAAAHSFACACACAVAREHVCLCMCVCACVRERACNYACERSRECACICACVRMCVRACLHVLRPDVHNDHRVERDDILLHTCTHTAPTDARTLTRARTCVSSIQLSTRPGSERHTSTRVPGAHGGHMIGLSAIPARHAQRRRSQRSATRGTAAGAPLPPITNCWLTHVCHSYTPSGPAGAGPIPCKPPSTAPVGHKRRAAHRAAPTAS
jgi:hypothetical protein